LWLSSDRTQSGCLLTGDCRIVGHEKPRITYGLYSGAASLKVKAEALAKLSYVVTSQ
jgi:hypothetical protein